MLVFKYRKTGASKFISHIDLLRHVERIMRRAAIPVKFSQGYNPHPLLYFSSPAVLGIGSTAEYLSVDSDISPEEALEKFNLAVPDTLKAEKCFRLLKNPNLQANVIASDYILPVGFKDEYFKDKFEITYQKKGETVVEDAGDRILDAFSIDGKLCVRLSTGSVNLRPDRVAYALNAKFYTEITLTEILKTAQYILQDGKLVDVDVFLKNAEDVCAGQITL